MGLATKPNTFAPGATILSAQQNENFDTIYSTVNGNISNVNIDSAAAIADTKLAQITTASKVSAAAITSLSSLPSAAGNLPSANSPDKVVLSATDSPTELTIASGAITVTQSFHVVDTEADAASDTLDTINGGVDGMILVLMTVANTRDVIIGSGGNINTAGAFTLDSNADTITLMYSDTLSVWVEIARGDNA